MTTYAVFRVSDNVEIAVPQPDTALWAHVPVGEFADGTTVWGTYPQVAWDWAELFAADIAALNSAIAADGAIKFRTTNREGSFVLCTGKTDLYYPVTMYRGRDLSVSLKFDKVVLV